MISFIILHYMSISETIECIKNLKKLNYDDKKIIIVDNYSLNNSGNELKNIYKDDSSVDIILNDKNLGFAKGNNVGCEYAKKHYDPDFYIVMNNDVEIIQQDFCQKVYDIYEKEKFDVLGPDIYSTSQNIHQSPKSLKRITLDEVLKLQKKYKLKINNKIWANIRCYFKQFKILNKKIKNNNIDTTKSYINVPLHGSCLIFSRKFVDSRKNVFFPNTFMYFESEILDYECSLYGFKEVYNPKIKVLHHQNVSTDLVYKDIKKKSEFMTIQNYKSINEFLKIYNK